MLETIATALNMNVISSISSTIIIILLGYICRQTGFFTKEFAAILSKVTLGLAVPALAFNAFMQDIDPDTLRQSIFLFVWGFVFYPILIPILRIFYAKYDGEDYLVQENLTLFGSTTFFALPIIAAVYGTAGVLYANIFNIGYRIWLYTYGSIRLGGMKFERKNLRNILLNPILVAVILGFIIWITQDLMPQITVSTEEGVGQFGILRIDQTAPWLYRPLDYLAGLASPVAWLAIGATLGEYNIKDAIGNKNSWYYSFVALIVMPALNALLIFLISRTGLVSVDFTAFATSTVAMAAPSATAITAIAIANKRNPLLASSNLAISTVAAVVITPIWIVILDVIGLTGLF